MSKKIAIIVDSSTGYQTGDLPNLYSLPLVIVVTTKLDDDTSVVATLKDGIECDAEKIFEMKKDKRVNLKTSQASIGEVIVLVEEIQDKYDEIYAIPIAGTVSGSAGTWKIVAQEYSKVKVIEHFMGGPVVKILVEAIYSLIDTDSFNDETLKATLANFNSKVYSCLVISDFASVAKSGRVKNFASYIISASKLKVIIGIEENGMKPYRLTRSFEKGLERVLGCFKKNIGDSFTLFSIKKMIISSCPWGKEGEILKKAIAAFVYKYKNIKIIQDIFSPILLVHSGSNAIQISIELI